MTVIFWSFQIGSTNIFGSLGEEIFFNNFPNNATKHVHMGLKTIEKH